MRIWLVQCDTCRGAFTGAKPPGHPEFEKTVQCVSCNKDLDATNGRFVYHKVPEKKEEIDLLSVL